MSAPTMRAMVLPALASLDENPEPLTLAELPVPEPGAGEIRIRIAACGVCHTELDDRSDVRELLALAAEIPLRPETQEFSLEAANEALRELKARKIRGAKVLRMAP